MITLDNVKEKLSEQGVMVEFIYNPISSMKSMKTTKQYLVELSSGEVINIPNGFVFDGPSTGKVVQALLLLFGVVLLGNIAYLHMVGSVYNINILYTNVLLIMSLSFVLNQGYEKVMFAGLVHDYLYVERSAFSEIPFYEKKAKYDREFYLWMKAIRGTSKYYGLSFNNLAIWLLYRGVQGVGFAVFTKK